MRTYAASTGRHRQPGGHNVLCGVVVSIMLGAAALTCPRAYSKRQRIADQTTCRACLTTRKEPVNNYQFTPVPCTFVLQYGTEFRPRRIGNRAGQAPVAHQVADSQVLDRDQLVILDDPSGQLVQKVPPPVSDPGVDSGHSLASLGLVLRSLLFTGQFLLRPRKTLLVVLPESRSGDLLSRGERHETAQSKIDPNCRVSGWRHLANGDIDEQRHEPSPRCVAGHRHSGGGGVLRQQSRPANVERAAHLRQCQRAISPGKRRPRVLGSSTRMLPRLEAWVLGALGEEACEGRLQVPQGLLQWNRRHLGEVGIFAAPLPLGQHRRCLNVGDSATFISPCSAARLQGQIVNLANTSKSSQQLVGLLDCWIEPVLEGLFHLLLPHVPKGSSQRRIPVRYS